MKIIIGFIIFLFGSLWLSIIISVGVDSALRMQEKRKRGKSTDKIHTQ